MSIVFTDPLEPRGRTAITNTQLIESNQISVLGAELACFLDRWSVDRELEFMRRIKLAATIALLAGLSHETFGAPIVMTGYSIETFATGVGAMSGMTMGSDGNLYVADNGGGRILKVAGDGSVTVVASGIANANGVARMDNGRIFTASGGNQAVYEVTTGTASVFVNSGLSFPTSVAALGNELYVSNSGNGTISKVLLDGTATQLLAGNIGNNGPYGISFDASGIMHFLEHSTGNVYSYDFVGNPQLLGQVSSLGGTYTGTGFGGQLFVTDVNFGDLMLLDGNGGMSVFASGFSAKVAPPSIGPNGIAFDGKFMYIGDGNTIYRIASVTVPEPSNLALLGLGLAGLGIARRRRMTKAPAVRPTAFR